MKAILLLISLTFLLASCTKDTSELVGEWSLIARLADPGDGSGTFQATGDSKIIVFDTQGNYTCSGTTCSAGISSTPSSGTYSESSYTISPSNCPNAGIPITFTLENDELIISYTCFEACQEKFVKVN